MRNVELTTVGPMHAFEALDRMGPGEALLSNEEISGRQNAVRRDLAGVAGATLLYFAFACQFEISETLNRWASGYESWQLDELPLTLLVLAAGLSWFAWRRLAELRAEARARQRAEKANAALLEQNRMLARRLIALQEQERRSLARELHDELGQCCIAIKVDASFLAKRVQNVSAAAVASAHAIVETADRVHQIVRSMLRRLRPSALDDLGLAACVQDLAESWGKRHSIACAFVPEGDLEGLEEPVNITAYRIVQECLTNVAKHSGARHASIHMQRVSIPGGGGALRITVEDDGNGLGGTDRSGGLGMLGMTERAGALGGTLRTERGSQGGLRVEVVLPAPR